MNDQVRNQVFFITSNQTKHDEGLKYSLPNKKLKENLTKSWKYRGEHFTVKVFSFEIVKNDLKEKDKDDKSKKYMAKVELSKIKLIKNQTFIGKIFFKEFKNNYIYDFEFDNYESWTGSIPPPNHIKFSKCEQLQIFNEMLNHLKVKQDHKLSIDLIIDSQIYLGNNFLLDFYLEILKRCYKQKEVKTLLMKFKLERVFLPEKIEPKKYSSILDLIEKKPDVIIKYCSEKDNKEKYYKLFYSLLLFFRANYEKEKAQSLLSQEGLRKYFVEILSENASKFSILNVPDDLIANMIKQENITFAKINGALTFIKSIEKLLKTINSNIDLIFEYCMKESKQIKMSEMANPSQKDNLSPNIEEVKKI